MRYLSERGFTLLELIIVLFIVGLAMTFTAMAVSRSYEKAVLRQETAKVQGTLRYARERSLIERVPVGFVPDENSGRYWLEKNGSPYGEVRQIADGLSIKGEPVVFLPKGNSTGGYITVTEEDEEGGIEEKGFGIEVDPVTGSAVVGGL